MIKRTLATIVVVASIAIFTYGIAFAAPGFQQENPGAFELLTVVLQDAYLKGLLPDSLNEQLADLFIDELIAPDTGETREQTRKRLSLGVDTWEAPFDFLLITMEEAYSAEVLDDGLSELLSDWFVDNLIAPASGETGDKIRERLRDKLAASPKRISESYGTLASPVPFRETAMTGNDLAITVVASNLDATEIVQGWSKLNASPEPGNKYVIARVRLHEGDDSLIQSFGLVGASGRIIRSDSPYKPCEWMPSGDSHGIWYEVFHLEAGQTFEGVLCFQAPIEEKSLSIFREVRTHWFPPSVTGLWAMSADSTGAEPRPAPSPISDNYGTLRNPVPLGQSALAPNGMAITTLSANLDAAQELEELREYGHSYYGPAEGNKHVTVRVRVESVIEPEDNVFRSHEVRNEDFGIVASSGRMISGSYYRRCSRAPEMLVHSDLFEGGWIEVTLCFEIPAEETGLTLYYESSMGYMDTRLGFWNVSSVAPPSPLQPPAAISDTYGTLAKPVPVGERALASDGIAMTVLSDGMSVDIWRARILVVRVRLEYFGGAALRTLDTDSFGLVNSAGLITYGERLSNCEHSYDLEAETFEGGWQEDDLCFRGTFDTDDLVLFYLPEGTDRVLGFWEVSSEFSPRMVEVPKSISGAYGTLDSPVPAGKQALTSDGVGITVSSALTHGALLGYGSSDTHTWVVVRIRVEGFGQDPNAVRSADERDFGVVGASGILDSEVVMSTCAWGDHLNARFFNGGWQDGELCFNVPVEEAEGIGIYYKPGGAVDPLGIWDIPESPAGTGISPISDTFGTIPSPVPFGERALVAGGVAVSVLSANTDADKIIAEASDSNSPPAAEHRYVVIRVRVENKTGYEGRSIQIGKEDFGIVTSSGWIIRGGTTNYFHQPLHCGVVPNELDASLSNHETQEGNLCFEVPVEEIDGLSIFYNPFFSKWMLGVWSVSTDTATPDPVESATSISETYGTRDRPVPFGERAVSDDGTIITVVSANPDATGIVEDSYAYNSPPQPGKKYIFVRVRVENHTMDEDALSDVDSRAFGIVTSSGTVEYEGLRSGNRYECGNIPDDIQGDSVFRDGYAQGHLCFEVPDDDSGLTLFYRHGDATLGFWTVSDPGPAAVVPQRQAAKPVSDDHGTWMGPVPFRWMGLASNGMAISVVDTPEPAHAIEDYGGSLGSFHIQIAEDSGEVTPRPRPGYEYFVARVFIENRSGVTDELMAVSHRDFGLITTSSRRVTYSKDYGCIEKPQAPTSDLIETYYFPASWPRNTSSPTHGSRPICVSKYRQARRLRVSSTDPGSERNTLTIQRLRKAPCWGSGRFWQRTKLMCRANPGRRYRTPYGRLGSQVPTGEKAVASDGIAVTVLSANLDANEAIEDASAHNPLPQPEEKYILVRVRAENASEKWNEVRYVGDWDFGVSLSSGLLRDIRDSYGPNHAMCAWVSVPDAFGASLFGGMSSEGNLCFQIPVDEAESGIFYMPFDSVANEPRLPSQLEPYDPAILDPYVLGYWAMPTE